MLFDRTYVPNYFNSYTPIVHVRRKSYHLSIPEKGKQIVFFGWSLTKQLIRIGLSVNYDLILSREILLNTQYKSKKNIWS